MFQSLNRAYKRSDSSRLSMHSGRILMFQSLNRAYKRSDPRRRPAHQRHHHVSIPQSGLQAFRRQQGAPGFRAPGRFNPSIGLTSVPTHLSNKEKLNMSNVSIPQSGLQAFRPALSHTLACVAGSFNPSIGLTSVPTVPCGESPVEGRSFNPSIGLTSVPTVEHIM